jgi:hypothetical protein
VDVPDFTAGAWKTNKPNMDINLEHGGNTKVVVSEKGQPKHESS